MAVITDFVILDHEKGVKITYYYSQRTKIVFGEVGSLSQSNLQNAHNYWVKWNHRVENTTCENHKTRSHKES